MSLEPPCDSSSQTRELKAQLQARIDQLEQQATQQALLHEIIQAIRDTLVLDEILKITVDRLHQALGVSRCLIFRPDPQMQMKAEHVSEATAERESLMGIYCDFYRYYAQSLSQGKPVILQRIDQNCSFTVQKSAKSCGIRALLIVPLLYHQHPGSPADLENNVYLGGISLHQCDRVREWTESEISFVQAIANQCAIAIQQADLYNKLQAELQERRQVEAALRKSERLFRAVFEQTFQFMWLISPEGTLLQTNQTALEFGGCHLEQVLGCSVWDTPWWKPNISTSDWIPQWESATVGAIATPPKSCILTQSTTASDRLKSAVILAAQGLFIRYKADIRSADGSKALIDFSLKPVKDEQGNVITLIAEGRDITESERHQRELKHAQAVLQHAAESLEQLVEERTSSLLATNAQLQAEICERQQVEEALRMSQARLQFLLSSTPGAVYSCKLGQNSTITFVSDNIQDLYGYQAEQFLENPDLWKHRLHPEDAACHASDLSQLLTKGYDNYEYRFQHQDGHYRWIYDQRRLVRDTQGNPSEIIGYCLDISDRKIVEERLKTSLKEKEVLLKEVHHRVKNNLQVISSLLKLQSRYINDDEVLSLFKDSYHRVRSMALIHEKLYVSEDLAKINVADYIENLTQNLFKSYSLNATKLNFYLDIDPYWLDVDTAIPCGLIINELVSNSIKYAFPDPQAGTIRVKFYLSNGQYVLTVSDDGIGLPLDFNLNTLDTLGLQLVINLTEQLEGNIEVRSNPGTLFTLTFPIQ